MGAVNSKKPPRPMCCVSIGYQSYLMPADAGMKVVQLMQEALRCDRDFSSSLGGHVYVVRDAPEIELAMVKPSQVRPAPVEPQPTTRGGKQLLIEG